MSTQSQHLTLFPDRCDRCGACKSVCPHNSLKIGAAFIYVDWRTCDACMRCVEVCDRNAIVSRLVPLRSSSAQSTVPLADVSKVVVGSRAEAKTVRKAAERAAKEKKSGKSPKKLATVPPVPKPAAKPVPAKRVPEKVASASKPGAFGAMWTLVDAVAVLGIMLVVLLIKNAVLELPQVALMPLLGKMVVRVVVLAAFYVAQFAAFGWLAGRHGVGTLEAFGLKHAPNAGASEPGPSPLGSAGLVVGLFVGCEVISIGYGLAMQAAGIVRPERLSSDLGGVFGSGPVGLASAVLLVAFAAPFAEEIAFRGIVLPALGNRWGMWVGILGSAALYAAYHANLWLFAPTMVLGVALGWLAWTRRSLWPAIALHVLYNAAAVAAAFATAG